MQRKIEIPKYKLFAEKNYADILRTKTYEGYNLGYRELDPIRVKSGQVSFFDAYSKTDAKPFMQQFDYTMATPFAFMAAGVEGSQRIAFAGLRFSKEEPAYFKLALHENSEVIKLLGDRENPIATSVHSGFIGFSDYLAHYDYARFVARKEDHPLEDVVRFDGDTALNFKFGSSQKISVFSSGFGDGEYPAYIGYTASGKANVIICDFLLLPSSGAKIKVPGTEVFEFDLDIEQFYQNDPALTDDENAIAKWSFVLDNKHEIDALMFYRAHAKRAYAHHNMRNYDKALEDYYVAIALSERLPASDAQKIRAWTLYDNAGLINRQQGNIEEAIRLFERGKAVGDHFYSGAYVNLIELYCIQKEYEHALATADEMVIARPQDPLSYIKRAEIHAAMGNYDRAIDNYDVLIVRFNWDDAILEKTSALAKLGRYDDALQVLGTYIRQNEPNDVYYYTLGYLLLKKERYGEAYENLLLGHEYNTAYLPILKLLIEIEEYMFDHPRLAMWATKYIELAPEEEYGYSVRADAYRILGKYSNSLADYEHVYNKINQDPKYLKNMIVVALASKNPKKAERILKQLKGQKGGWYAICYALILEKRGKLQRATRTYSVAALDTKNEDIISLATDFFIRTRNAAMSAGMINYLREAGSPTALMPREYNFCRSFADSKTAEKIIDEYIIKILFGSLDKFEKEEIKRRIKITAKRYL